MVARMMTETPIAVDAPQSRWPAATVMRADTTALRQAAPGLDAIAAALGETLRQLSAALDAEGSCWGGDEIGTSFGATYGPAAGQVRDALARLRDGVAGIGADMLTMAAQVERSDARARARLS